MTVRTLSLRFRALREDAPGEKIRGLFDESWPSYREWFLKEGDAARPTYAQCRRALRTHMPELVPTWEAIVDLAGGGDMAARFLSLWRPTPYLCACSQAVWSRDELALVRNYDYSPESCDGAILRSRWDGAAVLAMTDCIWGVLDGVNDHGLTVALSFGGRKVVGEGFGVTVVLRYVLQQAETTADAVAILCRVPMHMAYNVAVVDAAGRHATVLAAPDRDAIVKHWSVSTNHQDAIDWPQYAAVTQTVERMRHLRTALEETGLTLDDFIARFLEPPLYRTSFARGWGTIYTATYFPRWRVMQLRWPGRTWRLTLDSFTEGRHDVTYEHDDSNHAAAAPPSILPGAIWES